MTPSSERIGNGPWARLAASAIVPDESSSSAERGRQLAEGLELVIEQGVLSASVEGCDVRVSAEPVPPRIWAAMSRYARGNHQLEAGVAGTAQSVHLEHLLLIDWEQPLVPPTRALVRQCSCDAGGACKHVAALAFAFARAIDRDPSALLTWRGCVPGAAEPEPDRSRAARRRSRPATGRPARCPSSARRGRCPSAPS